MTKAVTETGDLTAQVRAALADVASVHEVRMFGGIGFMLNGNLLAAASKRGLLLRVGKERLAEALSRPGARQMEMRGRVMADYVYVDPPPLIGDATQKWLRLALAFVQTLPPKVSGTKPAQNARKKGKQR